ncbi:H-NS family nucleoid-associated regulatory protein [Comamonas sp. GB3 AK4-5]|uniref:H-NS family nucleoid-associated regulatory protein n=1 Tax=Comamonas sp. GB3 AK4-5 TaxID=3231487 RepID=UPI00351E85D8
MSRRFRSNFGRLCDAATERKRADDTEGSDLDGLPPAANALSASPKLLGLRPELEKKIEAARAQALAKYRNPKTGAIWAGRDKKPVWIRSPNRAAFLIAQAK